MQSWDETARFNDLLARLSILLVWRPPHLPHLLLRPCMNTGNGGPTRQDSYFLSPLMPKTVEMALPVPTKTILPWSPDTAMLLAPSGCTPPTSPCPALSAVAEPISQGHCRKSHDEAESIMTTFGAMGPKGLSK